MKKYHIYTFGCKVNQYESQLISEKFKSDNFKYTRDPKEADIIIFNSCTVTSKTDKKCEYFLRKTTRLSNKPKIILTGCIVKNRGNYVKKLLSYSHDIEVIADKTKLFTDPQKQTVLGFDRHSRAFLKIQDGCNSFCSYCIVPYVRGILWSKPEKEVLSEIENLIKHGYSEIVMTGINIGEYRSELSKTGLSELIEKTIKIPLNFRIRISSIELNEIDDKLIELIKENPEKICRHLHIPLQSGSDEILRQMNRKYSSKKFEKKINKIVRILPDIALTTDIITGFPNETKKHHRETCDIIKRILFARLHIFRYSDREGTKASTFKNKVHTDDIKNRSKELSEINFEKRKIFLKKHIGTKRNAVKIGNCKALTDNYIKVEIQESKNNDHPIYHSAPKYPDTNAQHIRRNQHSQLFLKNGIFKIEITETSKV
ncbi:MAG: tRNA (N(6)-L-threonylcarbamoyladenosine(37)-C(2))-methylthiotransferase MtaB [Endomicrobium sp.]|jgi:threonylcarbamoyladenosine tRNA methylthiotransferase MtaB|nr:tRNA (N(6)-L-threonylcarbamoyladenosine(37)-C(2))-methylthiotransferase MtaB [Endomicrobium sp.]